MSIIDTNSDPLSDVLSPVEVDSVTEMITSYRGLSCLGLQSKAHLVSDLACTGLSVWESAYMLIDLILDFPKLFHGKHVLELGSGLGLCSLAAASVGGNVIATDRDDEVLRRLRNNTALEPQISVQTLIWGQPSLLTCDVIIGSDLIYLPSALAPLLMTISAALPSLGVAYISHSYATLDWAQLHGECAKAGMRVQGLLQSYSIFGDRLVDEQEEVLGQGILCSECHLWARGILQLCKS